MFCGVVKRIALLAFLATPLTCVAAQPLPLVTQPRPLCITDPQGVSFSHWYGAPVAFNSYFSFSPYSAYGGNVYGNSFTTNGYFLGAVPVVVSATTPEWVVQRTSVFPIASSTPWQQPPPPWLHHFGRRSQNESENRAESVQRARSEKLSVQ